MDLNVHKCNSIISIQYAQEMSEMQEMYEQEMSSSETEGKKREVIMEKNAKNMHIAYTQ